MKIALVNPNTQDDYPQPPLGLLALASVCLAVGHEATIVDANAERLPVEAVIDKAQAYDVIGITAMTPSIEEALNIARISRHRQPWVPLLLGGVHATIFAGELSQMGLFDSVICGEGEGSLLAALEALKRSEKPAQIYSAGAEVNIENLPLPPYYLLNLNLYHPHPPQGIKMPWISMITSRGCPYNCAFCSNKVFGQKYRAIEPSVVVSIMTALHDCDGIREVRFCDDVFTLNRQRTHDLCERMQAAKLNVAWSCETRVNLVDSELLKAMRRAGCYSVSYGIESGNQWVLDSLNKKTKLEQITKAVQWTREAGMRAVGYFMFGVPGETQESIERTINYSCKLGLNYAQFGIACPLPGSQLYRQYLAKYNDRPVWSDFHYTGDNHKPMFVSEYLSRSDLEDAVHRANRRFYLRFRYVLGWLFRALCSWGELRFLVRGLSMFGRVSRRR